MPLLEVIQTKQISASIRLTETTATQVDQYAAFIHAGADDVVEQALVYVFLKDRDFQDFLKTPQAEKVPSTLRVRKAPVSEAAVPVARKPAPLRFKLQRPRRKALEPPLHSGQKCYGAAHRMDD